MNPAVDAQHHRRFGVKAQNFGRSISRQSNCSHGVTICGWRQRGVTAQVLALKDFGASKHFHGARTQNHLFVLR
jgi:hypothetical protein